MHGAPRCRQLLVQSLNQLLWPVQIAFMQKLMAEGVADKKDIVFLDMDVLVVDSLAEVSIAASTASLCMSQPHAAHA